MNTTILQEARQLSISERVETVEAIWDSIAEERDRLPVTNYQKKELDRRLYRMQSNPEEKVSWDSIKAATGQSSTISTDLIGASW